MPQGFISFGARDELAARLAQRRRERVQAAEALPAWEPGVPVPDFALRPTARMEMFDFGEPVPPAWCSSPLRSRWPR